MKKEQANTADTGEPERQCPFVSENGPECPICGAPPTQVNLDPQGKYGHCDNCGSKFPLDQ